MIGAVLVVLALGGAFFAMGDKEKTVRAKPSKNLSAKEQARKNKANGLAAYRRCARLYTEAMRIGFGNSGYDKKCREVFDEAEVAIDLLDKAAQVFKNDPSIEDPLSTASKYKFQAQKGMGI